MERSTMKGRRGPRTWRDGSLLLTLGLVASCSTTVSDRAVVVDEQTWAATGGELPVALLRTPDQTPVTIDEAADELAIADVIFLGEQHDSAEGHAVQLALTKAIAERRGGIILSMEMLERDSQRLIDMYFDGRLDEERFRASARLWPNYEEHYRPAVEFARENGYDVLASNVYRPIASRVARRGLPAAQGEIWAARVVDVSDGEYRTRFNGVMSGGHSEMDSSALDNIYAAQCLKDDTMAESIARRLATHIGEAPPVVHWNGRFHSDFGLGTVERLRNRCPDLSIAVVSMITDTDIRRELVGDEVDQGHFVIMVQAPEIEVTLAGPGGRDAIDAKGLKRSAHRD